ncbi:hypothetical protein OIV83_006550, partial [Microbotryomycetes sp. JL201]
GHNGDTAYPGSSPEASHELTSTCTATEATQPSTTPATPTRKNNAKHTVNLHAAMSTSYLSFTKKLRQIDQKPIDRFPDSYVLSGHNNFLQWKNMLRMQANIRVCNIIFDNATSSSEFFAGDNALWHRVNKLAHSALCSNVSDNIFADINSQLFESTGDAYRYLYLLYGRHTVQQKVASINELVARAGAPMPLDAKGANDWYKSFAKAAIRVQQEQFSTKDWISAFLLGAVPAELSHLAAHYHATDALPETNGLW